VTLNIGANDELHTLGKVEGESKLFVEAKVKAAVEAKLVAEVEEAIAKEAIEAKIAEQVFIKCSEKAFAENGGSTEEPGYKELREKCLATEGKKLGEEYYAEHKKQLEEEGAAAVGAKFTKIATEAINAKVGEQVFKKCSEKAFAENGGSTEEPGYKELREKCLATEGKKLGEEYFAEHKAQLEKEGKEAVEAFIGKAIEAKLAKFAEAAISAKVGEQVFKKCSEKAFAENGGSTEEPGYKELREKCLATEGKKLGEEYFAEHKAQLEKEGKEAVEAKLKKDGEEYFAANAFKLTGEGEIYGAELVGKLVPGLFKQILSNISGILVALRSGGSIGLDGGKAVNYTGRIIFQGGYNPFGKLFHLAKEGQEFVAAAPGGAFGPYKSITGRCIVRGLTAEKEQEKIEAGCTASEVQAGFSQLVKTLNELEYTTVHGGFASCMSFPANEFNTGSQTVEPERLKLWVNMTNATESNGKVNGPDIHPTPAGYTQLSKEMVKEMNGKCHKQGLPGF
jgi:hypothetical protein